MAFKILNVAENLWEYIKYAVHIKRAKYIFELEKVRKEVGGADSKIKTTIATHS